MGNLQLLELQNPSKTQIKNKYHLGNNFATMSDKDLLALCQKYGTQAILWKRKFIGLLPEVNRRELYEKKKCSSVYEFAAKFGGVTKKHTQRVIQIDKAFEEKGVKMLREMLQEGAVSISKLVKVVSVVSIENESDIVIAIKRLSHESLETYVRDMRRTPERERRCFGEHDDNGTLSNNGTQIGNGSPEPSDCPKSVRPNTFAEGEKVENVDEKADGTETNEVRMQNQAVALKKIKLNLSDTARAKGLRGEIRSEATMEVFDEMLELQGKGIDVDALLKEFLRNREGKIAEKKEETVRKVTGREERRRSEGKKPVRQISVKVKRVLKEEYGTKCAVGGCDKAAEHLHHTVPFSINGSNSPDLLRPLCRAHHDIVHSVNARYLEKKVMG